MGKYDDIIGLPHHRSAYRPAMLAENRAAQFAPFAALTGHDEAIIESARLTDARRELSDEEKERLGRHIERAYRSGASVEITYFQADRTKEGGEYIKVESAVVKVDEVERRLTLASGRTIAFDDILSIV